VLGKGGQEDVEHLGDTKISSATKIQALPPPDSPVGVEEDPMKPNPNEDTPPPNKLTHPAVTINEEPITSPALECSTTTGNTSTRGSALKNPSPAQATDDVPPMPQVPSLGKFTLKGLEQGTNYIIHRNQKMYSMRNNNKQEQWFHVEDFIGLFPAWPVIELSIAPTGSTKDKRMTSFLRCFAALFNEIKYVNDTAAIAPINIYDDSKDNFIVDRSGLPDNFTKLGKWLMISRGSGVFEKKEKGNGKVFARFCLKFQEKADKIINWVSFKFNRLGGSRLSKKTMQAMETETPMML
jgi:hypothetical protein